jgi:8-oxo-dGTP pyrophosphatase MutT (NUDIX family)
MMDKRKAIRAAVTAVTASTKGVAVESPLGITLVYAQQEPPDSWTRSVFLAGPTPRDPERVASWRPDAIRALADAGYRGVVFVPEAPPGVDPGVIFGGEGYRRQVDWETEWLNACDAILMWIPRDLGTLPAFTTNCEFGEWHQSGKLVLGAPPDAPKNQYLLTRAGDAGAPVCSTLSDTVEAVLKLIGDGALRHFGERHVPAMVWNTLAFQRWYDMLRAVGDQLDHARVEWTFRVGPDRRFAFFWILHVQVWIRREDRVKSNEVVIARPDIGAVVLYQRAATVDDSLVVLVREFRSPVRNPTGYVWECPGGSSFDKKDEDPRALAAHECEEETGLLLAPGRFRPVAARQVAATMSAHHAHVYSAELTDAEVQWLQAQEGEVFGAEADTERTYVHVMPVSQLRATPVDWATLGMIYAALEQRAAVRRR